MTLKIDKIISHEEMLILEEIMNIGFGNATADLAEVIDIHIQLSVPDIQVTEIGELPEHIKKTIGSYDRTSIVYQKFFGDFSGSGLLILPARAAEVFLNLLMYSDSDSVPDRTMTTLEEDSLLEIGNILIGACVGKISELLKTYATYTPPQIFSQSVDDYDTFINSFTSFQTAIVMKTVFSFDNNDLRGVLMLLSDQESINWLQNALHKFLEPYK